MNILNPFFDQQLKRHNMSISNKVTHILLAVTREVFENRIISLKGKVYKMNLHAAKDVKNEVTDITASVY